MSDAKPPPLPLRYRWKYARSIPLTVILPSFAVIAGVFGYYVDKNINPVGYIRRFSQYSQTPIAAEDFEDAVDLDFGFCAIKGKAKQMEDRAWIIESKEQTYVGIFDGSEGTQTVEIASQAMRLDIITALREFQGKIPNPDTFLVASGLMVNKQLARFGPDPKGKASAGVVCQDGNKLFITNVGKTSTWISRCRRPFALTLYSSWKDKSTDPYRNPNGMWKWLYEFTRWRSTPKGIEYVMDDITRLYGDNRGRVDPDVGIYEFNKEDEFVVTATPGVWDVLPPKELFDYLQGLRLLNPLLSANYMARAIVFRALALGSNDSLAASVITLQHHDPEIEMRDEQERRWNPGRMIIRAVMKTH